MKRSLSPETLHLVWQTGWVVAGACLLWRSRRELRREPDGRTAWTGEASAFFPYFFAYAVAWLAVNVGLAAGMARELAALAPDLEGFNRALLVFLSPALMASALLFMRRFTPEFSPQRPHRVKPAGDFGFTPAGILRGFSGALLLTNVTALLWSAALYLLHKAGGPDFARPQESVLFLTKMHDWRLLAPFVAGAVIFAPIHEELFYRGGLFPFLRARLGGLAAYAACGVIFGAIHLNLFAFLPLAVFGAWLARLYDSTADLRVPITVHALFNLSTVIWAVLAPGAVS